MRNKAELSPTHITVLRDLKQHTESTLPVIREMKELGIEWKDGPSLSQERHFEKYVRIKFGIEEKNFHGEGTSK